MGEVVSLLPDERIATPRPTADTADAEAGWHIDDWGRDDTLARLAARALHIGWSVTVGGVERLPKQRPAMLVTNARRLTLSSWFVALLASSTERPVRFVGRPDSAPVGALARRLGGLLARPDEVRGALADGQLVVVSAATTFDPRAVGAIDPVLLSAAVRADAPVFPVATSLAPLSRSARVEIGAAVRPPSGRRGPLREVELAERVRQRIAELIDATGTPRTGTPLDWIPLSLSALGEGL